MTPIKLSLGGALVGFIMFLVGAPFLDIPSITVYGFFLTIFSLLYLVGYLVFGRGRKVENKSLMQEVVDKTEPKLEE